MPTDADLAGGARGCRRKTTSDISALLEEAHAAREEEARLDAELAATRREIESVRLSLATVARVSLITTAWAKRARQRAVTLGIVSTEQTARDAALAHQMSFAREPQPEPEPEPTSEPVHVVPTDSDPRADRTGWPDWALSSERSAARDLVKEPADLGKGDVERGQVEIYENQRRSLLGDFSAKNLLPGTRGAWSDINGAEVERGRLPHGWHWAVEHRQGRTDPEGWEYAFHFRASWFPQPEREGSFGGPAWVRRRKWVPTQSFRAATHVKLASPAADVAAGLRPAQTYQCARLAQFPFVCSWRLRTVGGSPHSFAFVLYAGVSSKCGKPDRSVSLSTEFPIKILVMQHPQQQCFGSALVTIGTNQQHARSQPTLSGATKPTLCSAVERFGSRLPQTFSQRPMRMTMSLGLHATLPVSTA